MTNGILEQAENIRKTTQTRFSVASEMLEKAKTMEEIEQAFGFVFNVSQMTLDKKEEFQSLIRKLH
jgi:hypothetical protein